MDVYILACQVYERTVGGIAMPGIKTKVYLDIFLFSVTCMHNTRSYRAGDFCSTLWFNFHEDQFQLSSACMLTAVLINFATQVRRLWFMLLHHVATNCNEKSSTYSGCSSKATYILDAVAKFLRKRPTYGCRNGPLTLRETSGGKGKELMRNNQQSNLERRA